MAANLSKRQSTASLRAIKRLIMSHCRSLTLGSRAEDIARENDFQLAGYKFRAESEDTRSPRITRVGLVQNKIVKPTSDPVTVQRDALFDKMKGVLEAAAAAKVNVLCFQEAWSTFPLNCCRLVVA